MTKILLVEDDTQLADNVKEWLEREHYNVDVAYDGADGLQLFEHNDYDLSILDWELPSMTGVEICKQIRLMRPKARVIFLTGRGDMHDKLLGYETGVDDYVVKPFHAKEFSARVRALLRRVDKGQEPVLRAHDLELVSKTFKVSKAGKPLNLLPKEFALLEFFMQHPNQVYSAKSLLREIWPTDSDAGEDAVRTQIKTLRRKITAPGQGCPIVNELNVGYRFEI
jgi:two-component system, OmpR family, manganese sensing response regulator